MQIGRGKAAADDNVVDWIQECKYSNMHFCFIDGNWWSLLHFLVTSNQLAQEIAHAVNCSLKKVHGISQRSPIYRGKETIYSQSPIFQIRDGISYSSSPDGNVTTSTLSFVPSLSDAGEELICRAGNTIRPASTQDANVMEDQWRLEIHCEDT